MPNAKAPIIIVTHVTGSLLRLLQTGNVQTYALLLALGMLVLLWATLF